MGTYAVNAQKNAGTGRFCERDCFTGHIASRRISGAHRLGPWGQPAERRAARRHTRTWKGVTVEGIEAHYGIRVCDLIAQGLVDAITASRVPSNDPVLDCAEHTEAAAPSKSLPPEMGRRMGRAGTGWPGMVKLRWRRQYLSGSCCWHHSSRCSLIRFAQPANRPFWYFTGLRWLGSSTTMMLPDSANCAQVMLTAGCLHTRELRGHAKALPLLRARCTRSVTCWCPPRKSTRQCLSLFGSGHGCRRPSTRPCHAVVQRR
eukprot:scaffold3050_cov362-Prasinococcus_capsulatus_cf.AAC.6